MVEGVRQQYCKCAEKQYINCHALESTLRALHAHIHGGHSVVP